MTDILYNTDYDYLHYYLVLLFATTAAIYIVEYKERKVIPGGSMSRKLKLARWFLNAFLLFQIVWFFLLPVHRFSN